MTTYTNVFGGANIYPSEVSYSSLTLTADVVLSWPEETSTNENLATRIIDVTAATGGWSIYLPDARKGGDGQTILFTNYGATQVLVKNATGTQQIAMAAGTSWQIYLTDNTTEAGTWRTFQYGAALSAANASALAGTGLIAIGSVLSQDMPTTDFNSNYTAGDTDRSKFFVWSGAGGTLTLPSAAAVGNGWFINLSNQGSGALTVDPSGSVSIDGSSTKTYNPGESSMIVTDGVNYYSIGYGKDAVFAFDYTSIAIGGTGDYTLTGSELNRIAYDFTGTLTGNRNVIVPVTVQQYWVTNSTTGAYDLTIKTAAGTGYTIAQGQSAILYCNGTNVVPADTAGVALPILVAEGGTGATTAAGARINLGGTSLGISLFTSASASAARTDLGATSVGAAVFTAADEAAARADLGSTTIGDALFVAADHAAAWAALGSVDGGSF
jgi:hypothetical protein